MNTAPDTFLGQPVPEHLKQQWRTWEAAEWRQQQYRASNRLYPPDERFNVTRPKNMCERHAQMWLDYRNMHFDPRTGDRWPGNPGSPFLFVGHDTSAILEQRRVEWDEKASEQMRFLERTCLSGSSSQCTRPEETADVVPLAAVKRRSVENVELPAEAS